MNSYLDNTADSSFIPKLVREIFDDASNTIGTSIRIPCSQILSLSKHGKIVSWERGGYNKDIDQGYSIIWSDASGLSLNPLFIVYKHTLENEDASKFLANQQHGLFEIRKGYFVFISYYDGKRIFSSVFKLKIPMDNEYYSELKMVNSYTNFKWDGKVPLRFINAINASIAKALCRDCTHVHYYKSMLITKIIKGLKSKGSRRYNNNNYNNRK